MVTPVDLEARARTFVRAAPMDVYNALTTAAGLDAWFTKGAEVEPRPGGRIVFRWRDWGADKVNFTANGRVLEVDRPRRFVFQWWDEDDTSTTTTVEFTLEPREGGTIVQVREFGFAETPRGQRRLIGNAAGWGECLTLAKFYVEHGLRY